MKILSLSASVLGTFALFVSENHKHRVAHVKLTRESLKSCRSLVRSCRIAVCGTPFQHPLFTLVLLHKKQTQSEIVSFHVTQWFRVACGKSRCEATLESTMVVGVKPVLAWLCDEHDKVTWLSSAANFPADLTAWVKSRLSRLRSSLPAPLTTRQLRFCSGNNS